VKCRERRKVWAVDLAKRAAELESSNYLHTVTISALNSEMSLLKEEVLKHARCGLDRVSTSATEHDSTNNSTSVEQDLQTIGTSTIASRKSHDSFEQAISKPVIEDCKARTVEPDSRVIPGVDNEQSPFIESIPEDVLEAMSEDKLEALLMDQLAQATQTV